jgi:hypothetical protein
MNKMGRRQLYLERGGSGGRCTRWEAASGTGRGMAATDRPALGIAFCAKTTCVEPDASCTGMSTPTRQWSFQISRQWSFPFIRQQWRDNLCGRRKPSRGSRMAIRSGLSRFRCSAVMVVCILPGLSPTVTNGLPLIRCRTVTWSWLEGGLLFFSPIDSLRLFLRS